ncbi:hypothetical protein ACVR1I_09455 [Streptococcus cameli]
MHLKISLRSLYLFASICSSIASIAFFLGKNGKMAVMTLIVAVIWLYFFSKEKQD